MNPKAFAPPLVICGTFYTLAAASLCFGQAARNAAESAATAAQPPIELSPFVVTETDDGWLAAHTVLSNRTNQPLKEVPASIEALTPDFLAEVGAYDAFEAFQFVTNALVGPEETMAQTLATGGGPNLENNRYSYRGIANEGQPTRNLWSNASMPSDSFNVERIEAGRGSNSLLFGEMEAGGQGNIWTKRGVIGRNFGSFLGQVGSHDSYRFNLDYNHSFSNRLAGRLNLTRSSSKRDFDWNYFDTDAVHGAVTYRPFKNTLIRAEAEWARYARNWGTNQMMLDERAAPGRGFSTKWTVMPDNTVLLNTAVPANDRTLPNGVRYTYVDADGGYPRHYNWAPNQYNDKEIATASIYLEQKVNDFAFELAFNWQDRELDYLSMKQSNLIRLDSTGRRFINYTYLRGDIFDRDRNVRAMGTYEWKPLSWMKQLFVGTATYSISENVASSFMDVNYLDAPGGVVNVNNSRLFYRVYLDDPSAYSPALLDRRLSLAETSAFRVMQDYRSGVTAGYSEAEAYTLSMSGNLWNGRLLTQVGARLDRKDNYNIVPWTAANRLSDGQSIPPGSYADHPERYTPFTSRNTPASGDISKNFGLTYRLNDRINLYGVFSESFRTADGNAFNFTGEPLGQQRGETKEIGLKSEFLQRKLVWSLAAFDIARENVAINFPRNILSESELEDLFNPNGLSPTDPKYITLVTAPVDGAGRDERTAFSKGVESSITFQAAAGLRMRMGAGFQKVSNDPATTMSKFKELLAAAIARGNEDPALVAGAQQILDEVGALGDKVTGRAAAPFTFNYAINYSPRFLPGFNFGVNGIYNSDYVLNYIDGVEYRGGKMLTVNGTAAYQTRIKNRRVTFRLNVKDIVENEYVTRNVVKLANGTLRRQNYYGTPTSFLLTSTVDF